MITELTEFNFADIICNIIFIIVAIPVSNYCKMLKTAIAYDECCDMSYHGMSGDSHLCCLRGGVVICFIIIVVDMYSETNCWQLNKFGASLLHLSRFQLYAQNAFIERCSRHTF